MSASLRSLSFDPNSVGHTPPRTASTPLALHSSETTAARASLAALGEGTAATPLDRVNGGAATGSPAAVGEPGFSTNWRVKWKPEEDAELRRLIVEERLSLRLVALAMGMTRNKVSGRAARLGIKSPSEEGRARSAKATAGHAAKRDRFMAVVRATAEKKAAAVEGSGCRWLHGDPGHLDYCNAPLSGPERSWCAEHRARVYVSVVKKAAA